MIFIPSRTPRWRATVSRSANRPAPVFPSLWIIRTRDASLTHLQQIHFQGKMIILFHCKCQHRMFTYVDEDDDHSIHLIWTKVSYKYIFHYYHHHHYHYYCHQTNMYSIIIIIIIIIIIFIFNSRHIFHPWLIRRRDKLQSDSGVNFFEKVTTIYLYEPN